MHQHSDLNSAHEPELPLAKWDNVTITADDVRACKLARIKRHLITRAATLIAIVFALTAGTGIAYWIVNL